MTPVGNHSPHPVISAEDEQRPVVGFLRRWREEDIAKVVAAHKRGETFKVRVTL